jgi:hypothetical protein
MEESPSLFVVIDHRRELVEAPRVPRHQGPLHRLARNVGERTSLVGLIAFIIYVTVVGVTVSIAVSNRNVHREALAAEAAAAAQSGNAP